MTRSDRPAEPGDERDVDFVVGGQDVGADETLPPPPGVGPNTRLRIGLGVGALVLFITVLVARAALSPDSAPQAARTPSVTPSVTPSSIVSAEPGPTSIVIPTSGTTLIEVPTRLPNRRGHDPLKCPGLRCSASPALPGLVLRAIQAAFPESTIERAVTIRLRGHRNVLWYREIDVQVASEYLILRIEAPARGQRIRAGSRQDANAVTSYDETTLGPWHVSVELVDRLGGQGDLSTLQSLVLDARIVAV